MEEGSSEEEKDPPLMQEAELCLSEPSICFSRLSSFKLHNDHVMS